MASTPRRLGLILEDSLGHATHGQNLSRAVARDPSVVAQTIALPYDTPNWWAGLPGIRSNWSLRASLGANLALKKHANSLDALLFHTQVTSLLSAGLMRKIPALISLDATPVQYDALGAHYGHAPSGSRRLESFKAQLNQRAFAAARGLITWSEWAKHSLIADYGVPAEKITVISPGVDIQSWDDARKLRAPKSTSCPLNLLFVGGDFVRKGGDTLLAAMDSLPEHLRERVHLHVVTKSVGIESGDGLTVYRGVAPNSETLRTLFASADIFVFPTRADCLPQAILEAMAARLPVITTAVAAIPEAVRHEETGLIVAPDDVTALARSLERLLTDLALRARLGEAAYERARTHYDAAVNYPRIVEQLKAISAR